MSIMNKNEFCICGERFLPGAQHCITCGTLRQESEQEIRQESDDEDEDEDARQHHPSTSAYGLGLEQGLLVLLAGELSNAEQHLKNSHANVLKALAERCIVDVSRSTSLRPVAANTAQVTAMEGTPPLTTQESIPPPSEMLALSPVVPMAPKSPPVSFGESSRRPKQELNPIGFARAPLPGMLKDEETDDSTTVQRCSQSYHGASEMLLAESDSLVVNACGTVKSNNNISDHMSPLSSSNCLSSNHLSDQIRSLSSNNLADNMTWLSSLRSAPLLVDGLDAGIEKAARNDRVFELQPCWTHMGHTVQAGKDYLGLGSPLTSSSTIGWRRSLKSMGTAESVSWDAQESLKRERASTNNRRVFRKIQLHPCSLKSSIWDVTSLCLVMYDVAVIPLQLLEPPRNLFVQITAWVTRCFWSFDLPLSFVTGFLLSDGSVETAPEAIAWHYFSSWFFLDLVLVTLDWAEVILPSGDTSAADASSYGKVGRFGRVFRFLRMFRLLRLARMREVINLFTFRIHSEKVTIIADIAKVLLLIVLMAHVMACCWYGICNIDNPGPASWIVLQDAQVDQSGLEKRYVLSLHWSLAQFAGGMDEMKAHNFRERLYNVLIFLVAFMMANFCLSTLTSSMTRLHILNSHQSRQLSILRRYLIQNGIPEKLALRVQRNALHAISEQQRLMGEKNVELLTVISDPLRVELHFEMYFPVLEVHPFFLEYMNICRVLMQKVCHLAMSTLLVTRGDVIFSYGEIPDNSKMYIVCNGVFDYVPARGKKRSLDAEHWLAEAGLWIHHWMHRGILKGTMEGRLCVLASKRFSEIVRQFEQPERFNPMQYAKAFAAEITKMGSDGEQITDLPLGCEEQLRANLLVNQVTKEGGRRTLVGWERPSFRPLSMAIGMGSKRNSMMDQKPKPLRKRSNRTSVLMHSKSRDMDRKRSLVKVVLNRAETGSQLFNVGGVLGRSSQPSASSSSSSPS